MRYLVIAPQLGYELTGDIVPGGLLQFGRCVVRAMASFPQIQKLGVWCQVDPIGVEDLIKKTVMSYAHSSIQLDVQGFSNSRTRLASKLMASNIQGEYDRVMYLLVNQSSLSRLPLHPPYDVWEIGEELFLRKLSKIRRYSLQKADRLLSISQNTAIRAMQTVSGLPESQVVHLCLEPPLYAVESDIDVKAERPYLVSSRKRAVLIVANMHINLLYKGHQQLILGWPRVIEACPDARLWIVGDGSGRSVIEALADTLEPHVRQSIELQGRIDDESLSILYEQCRVFAMPSTGEGFGLVFVEAARYGIPCIGGKYDSVREIIIDNETGLLVEQDPDEVAQACIKLLTNDNLAEQLGNAAQQRYLQTFRFSHFQARLATALGFQ